MEYCTGYIRTGGGNAIPLDNVIGIFDADTSTVSSVTKKFLGKMSKEEKLRFVPGELPKSFILTENGGDFGVVFSSLSVRTLRTTAGI